MIGTDLLVRWAMIALMIAAAFGAGFIKGCAHQDANYAEAKTVFVERAKEIVKIERVEVVKFKTQIEWLKETETQLIEAAKNDPPNPAVCDFSPERLQRLRLAATGGAP